MNDHETLLTAAWAEWHFGVDPEIMPQPNSSFKAGFNAGLVAAHESHCKAEAERGDFSQWNQIDYNDPSTYPEENRPCIVAWAEHPEHPDRHAMHVFNDVGDDIRLWQNAIGDEVHDWDGTDENPTHWRYAPEYQP